MEWLAVAGSGRKNLQTMKSNTKYNTLPFKKSQKKYSSGRIQNLICSKSKYFPLTFVTSLDYWHNIFCMFKAVFLLGFCSQHENEKVTKLDEKIEVMIATRKVKNGLHCANEDLLCVHS